MLLFHDVDQIKLKLVAINFILHYYITINVIWTWQIWKPHFRL